MSTSAPQTTDPVGAFFVALISGFTSGVEVPLIEAQAEAAEPILALPVLKQIFEWLVSELAGKISVAEQQGVLSIVFNIEAGTKLHAVTQSFIALQNARDTGDQDAINQAQQDLVNKWGNEIHWGGVAPVHP